MVPTPWDPWHGRDTLGHVYDVVVLAGGSARRLGGLDKPGLVVGETTLLDRVLGACAAAARCVVVGPERPTSRPVVWTREQPPGAGPVPALAAGLELVTADTVLLLAADLPFLTASCVDLLVARAPAVLMGDGRRQWLCSAWPTAPLRQAVGAVEGGSLGRVLGGLEPAELTWQGAGRPWEDCDTEADVDRARGLVDRHAGP